MLTYSRALTRSGKPSTRMDRPKLLLETPCTLGGAPVTMLANAGLVSARYTVIAHSGATACASAILFRKDIFARRKSVKTEAIQIENYNPLADRVFIGGLVLGRNKSLWSQPLDAHCRSENH